MSDPIRLTREQLAAVFQDFETLRQFELVLETLDDISNTTLLQIQADVDQNTTDIGTNASNISTNTADIATNTANIATNAAAIAVNAANIAINAANIATNSGNISTNTANIATNTTNIATNTGNIATNTANIVLKAPIASPSFTGTAKTAGDTFGIDTAKTPSSASDTGTTGQIAWDSTYFYICVATDTWQRVQHTTW